MNLKGVNWYIEQPTQHELDELFNKSYYHVNYEKECYICGSKFKHGRSNCLSCNLHKIYTICPICKKWHKIDFNKLSGTQIAKIIDAINNNEELGVCCSLKCRQKAVYEAQRRNKTGWCSEEAIMKKNSYENNCIRQQNAAKNGNKLKSVQTQLARGLHPCQNPEILRRNVILMQLRKFGISDINFNDLDGKEFSDFLKLEQLHINGEIVSYKDSYKFNNRCGSIGLFGTNIQDNKRYALNAGKSVNLGEEIRKFWRIISQPSKQSIYYDYGRWYHIANDYKDFEIAIISIDVSEQEALLSEAQWAYKNNANFKYKIDENGNKIQLPNTHGYWM